MLNRLAAIYRYGKNRAARWRYQRNNGSIIENYQACIWRERKTRSVSKEESARAAAKRQLIGNSVVYGAHSVNEWRIQRHGGRRSEKQNIK